MSYGSYQFDVEGTKNPVDAEPLKKGLRLNLPAIGCIACIGLGAFFFVTKKESIDSADLAYLPDDSNIVVQLQVDRLCKSELYQQLKKRMTRFLSGEAPDNVKKLWEDLENKITTVTLGVKVPKLVTSRIQPLVVGVMHTNDDVVLRDLIPDEVQGDFREEMINGKKLIMSSVPQIDAGFCQIDSRTIVFGTKGALRDVLRRDGSPAISSTMKDALGEADFSRVLTVVADMPDDYFKRAGSRFQLQTPEAIVVNVDFDSEIHISSIFMMEDSSAADQLKTMVECFAPLAKAQATPEQRELLDSLDLSTSGSHVSFSMTIPGNLILEQISKQLRFSKKTATSNFNIYACEQNKAELRAAIERYYFENGSWPDSLDDLDNEKYFPDGVPRTCSVDNSTYVIDPAAQKILGHDHIPTHQRSANSSRSPRAKAKISACEYNKTTYNSMIDRYYFEKGEWPRGVDDLGVYFLGDDYQDVSANCPLDGVKYEIDPRDHRIRGHNH